MRPMRRTSRAALARPALAAVLLSVCVAAGASASDWTQREFARFRVLPASTAIDRSRELLVGLEVELEDGWQFYSENPGEFGVAPVFDWSASRNLAKASVFWPKPSRYHYSSDPPVSTLGYKGSLLLPVVLEPEAVGEKLVLRLDLEYAVCEEFCIIDNVVVELLVPAGRGRATRHLDRLQKALIEAKAVAR